MTNSINWMIKICSILGLIALILGISEKINSTFGSNFPINPTLLIYFLCLSTFALYAASIVFYRVFTFNNCEVASLELKKQIEEAKSDLMKKGLKFKEK